MEQRPEQPQQKPTHHRQKWIIAALCLVGAVLGKFGLFVLIKNGDHPLNAQKQTWEKEYKHAFIGNCMRQALLEIGQMNLYGEEFTPEKAKLVDNYTSSYCNCLSDKIAQANIIRPVGKGPARSLANYDEEMIWVVQDYLDSDEGMAATESCASLAE